MKLFLKDDNILKIDGYRWFGNNRKHVNKRSKRGSGGVGLLCKLELFFNISILDDDTEGILWLEFKSLSDNFVLCIAVCYIPDKDSVYRYNDPGDFFNTLLQQIYCFQNRGQLLICGDLNARVGNMSNNIEGVDDIRPLT